MRRVMRHVAMALTLAACGAPAFADEYSDVAQMMRSGKTTEAMARIDQHLASKPRDPQMRFFKGLIQREGGKLDAAIATFSALAQEFPELPEPHNNLAVLFAAQNDFEKARAALETAIRANPNYAVAHENLGDVYARLASQSYNKALQLDGSNTTVPPKLAIIREWLSLTSKTAAGTAPSPKQ